MGTWPTILPVLSLALPLRKNLSAETLFGLRDTWDSLRAIEERNTYRFAFCARPELYALIQIMRIPSTMPTSIASGTQFIDMHPSFYLICLFFAIYTRDQIYHGFLVLLCGFERRASVVGFNYAVLSFTSQNVKVKVMMSEC